MGENGEQRSDIELNWPIADAVERLQP